MNKKIRPIEFISIGLSLCRTQAKSTTPSIEHIALYITEIIMQEFTGLVYLLIDIANNYGLDKKSWKERIQWTREHMDELESHLKEAEEPALYYASVKALRQAQNKEQVHYPISLDATASGIQILSCLLHDRKAASKCNVINTGNREDIYTNIYNIMCKKVGDKARIKREMVKSAIMTLTI